MYKNKQHKNKWFNNIEIPTQNRPEVEFFLILQMLKKTSVTQNIFRSDQVTVKNKWQTYIYGFKNNKHLQIWIMRLTHTHTQLCLFFTQMNPDVSVQAFARSGFCHFCSFPSHYCVSQKTSIVFVRFFLSTFILFYSTSILCFSFISWCFLKLLCIWTLRAIVNTP